MGFVAAAVVLVTASAGCQRRVDLGPVADIATAEVDARRPSPAAAAAEAGEQAAASTGTGWATLRGQFVYDGTPPPMRPTTSSKEHNICAPGGQAPPQETLVVDSGSGGIKNVAAVLAKCLARPRIGAGRRPSRSTSTKRSAYFSRTCSAVSVGQPINIKNSDPTGHNTKIDGRSNKFNQTIPSGAAIPFTPQRRKPAPAPITCSIHPWMIAYMLPRQTATYAVTDAEGRFEIANLPAGEPLEFQVWHESGACGRQAAWSARRPTRRN